MEKTDRQILDAILQLVTVNTTELTSFRSEFNEFKAEMNEFRNKTDKRLGNLETNARQSNQKLGNIEKQMVAIGYELKDDVKQLKTRVSALESEVFS